MNDLHELEQDLSSTLHHYADSAPEGDGWRPIHDRIARRHRTRQIKRGVGTVAVMAVLIAGIASLVDPRVDVEGTGTVPAAPPAASPAVEPQLPTLPRLAPDVTGFEIAYAADFDPATAETGGPPGRPPATDWLPDDLRMTSLLEPAKGYEGRAMLVTVAGAQIPYGIGEDGSDPTASSVDIAGLTGYLTAYTSLPATSLGWRLADGRTVHLIGLRLSDDELVAAARAIQVAADSTVAWVAGSMPANLELRRTTVVAREAALTSEVLLKGDRRSLNLRLESGGDAALDYLVRDRAASSAYISSVTVSGGTGVFSVYERDQTNPGVQDPRDVAGTATLVWQVRPGVVAELVADGAVGDPAQASTDLIAAAESLREMSDAEWSGWVARNANDPSATEVVGAHAGEPDYVEVDLVASMCAAQVEWLAAQVNGDADQRSRVLAKMRQIFDQAAADDIGRNGDALVQLKRVVDAAEAGDVESVRSIPEGNLCISGPR